MEVTIKTMELAASVSHFDIIELWFEEAPNSFECKFAYATEYVHTNFPVIAGHYTQHSRDHMVSPQLCQRAKESNDKFCWLTGDSIIGASSSLPVKTEMSVFLDSDGIKSNVFLVCFSFSDLKMNIRMLQYLTGLTLSIYISAYFLDDENASTDLDSQVHGGVHPASIFKLGAGSSLDVSLAKSASSGEGDVIVSNEVFTDGSLQMSHLKPSFPTWEPNRNYSYPIAKVEVLRAVENNLSAGHFENMLYIASGSNSDVHRATFNSKEVAVKMLKETHVHSALPLHELTVEHGMLVRLQHENIITIIGAGESPQRFIALEYLGGGTLQELLHEDVKSSSLNFSTLFKKKQTMSLHICLTMARDIASAMDYLHERCCPDACIIHRDLKPDNIGFTDTMKLKLFDFGLMTCVKKPAFATDMYDMTGYTGSLRYMAPEVARKKPYNHKVDVHSFGIIVWEMVTGKVPFKGVNRDEFMSQVVEKNFRPNLSKTVPHQALANLLQDCWNPNPLLRPNFEQILANLTSMIAESEASTSQHSSSSSSTGAGGKKTSTGRSRWF